jgi:hypothetical protein
LSKRLFTALGEVIGQTPTAGVSGGMRRIARTSLRYWFVVLALWLAPLGARANELADFHAAVEAAGGCYDAAMIALETAGPEETASQVVNRRAAWHVIAERFGGHRPAAFADDEDYGAMFTVMDAQIVGALIVINAGRQDAARRALVPIGEKLADLSARSAGRVD